jgi:hypothetical protein
MTSRSTRTRYAVTSCQGWRSCWRRNSCAPTPSAPASISGSSTSTGSPAPRVEHPRTEQKTLRHCRRLCSSVGGLSLQLRIAVPATLGAPSMGAHLVTGTIDTSGRGLSRPGTATDVPLKGLLRCVSQNVKPPYETSTPCVSFMEREAPLVPQALRGGYSGDPQTPRRDPKRCFHGRVHARPAA